MGTKTQDFFTVRLPKDKEEIKSLDSMMQTVISAQISNKSGIL